MSAKTMGKVWDLVISPPKRLVLLALADHADHEDGNIFPSIALIAWKTDYSVRQVQRIMRNLAKDGILVEVSARRGKPTIYRLDLSKGQQKSAFEVRQDDTHDKMTPMTTQGKNESSTPDIASANLKTNHHKEEPKENTPARELRAESDKDIDQKLIGIVIKAWQDCLPVKPITSAYQNKAIRATAAAIIRAGYGAGDVQRYMTAQYQEQFWRGKYMKIATVAEHLPSWIQSHPENPTVLDGLKIITATYEEVYGNN